VEQRPGALDGGRGRRRRQPPQEELSQIGQRAVEPDETPGVRQRRALDEQADGEVPAERDGEVAGGHTVGPLLDLADDAGPAAEREELGAEERGPLGGRHAEIGERALDRGQRAPAGAAIRRDEPREIARPCTAARGERRVVDREEAAVDAAVPIRHFPVGEPLVEIPGEEADEKRVHRRVGVDAVRGEEQVAVADGHGRRHRRRRGGPARSAEARGPQLAHRLALVAAAIVGRGQSGEGRAGVCRKVGAEARERVGLLENPRQLAAGGLRDAMEDDRAPEVEAGAGAGDVGGASGAELFAQERLHVARADAARGELVAVPGLGEIGGAAEAGAGLLDGVLEGAVLERVERVVMDEDADRPLRGQEGGEAVEDGGERGVRGGGPGARGRLLV